MGQTWTATSNLAGKKKNQTHKGTLKYSCVHHKNRFTQNHVMLHGLTSAVRMSGDLKGLEITWQGEKNTKEKLI